VQDQISGFKGIVCCISTWLNGCVRVTLEPEKLSKDGKALDNGTFDEHQLKVIRRRVMPTPATAPGGPRPEPSRHAAPTR